MRNLNNRRAIPLKPELLVLQIRLVLHQLSPTLKATIHNGLSHAKSLIALYLDVENLLSFHSISKDYKPKQVEG